MVFTITLLLLVLIIVAGIILIKGEYCDDIKAFSVLVWIFGIPFLLFIMFSYNPIRYHVDITAVEKKIMLYEDQNKTIDKEMQEIVSSTYDKEIDTMKSLKTGSASSLVMIFPKLKSINLVNKQMDIYMSNKDKINKLRERYIDMEKYKIYHTLF